MRVPSSRVKGVRAVLFDAGGTLIHVDGERVCRAAGLAVRRGALPAAPRRRPSRAVRRSSSQRPESRDAERIPLYLDTMLAEPRRRRAGGRRRGRGRDRRRARRVEPLVAGAPTAPPRRSDALRGRGYRVAVVSNADGRVRGLLEAAGLAPLLEFVVDSAEVGVEKPDPRIFHAATEPPGPDAPRPAPTSATSTRSTSSAPRRGPRRPS